MKSVVETTSLPPVESFSFIPASVPITKLRGWGNEVHVLGGGIWRYQP